MGIDFRNVTDIVIPEGVVDKIKDSSGNVIWEKTITKNAHEITFVSLEGLEVTGLWNESEAKLEC